MKDIDYEAICKCGHRFVEHGYTGGICMGYRLKNGEKGDCPCTHFRKAKVDEKDR